MRASQSASTNIEEEVDLSTGHVINHSNIGVNRNVGNYSNVVDRNVGAYSDVERSRRRASSSSRGPNIIYSPGFSNTLVEGIQVGHSFVTFVLKETIKVFKRNSIKLF